jgi:hypothetical protein
MGPPAFSRPRGKLAEKILPAYIGSPVPRQALQVIRFNGVDKSSGLTRSRHSVKPETGIGKGKGTAKEFIGKFIPVAEITKKPSVQALFPNGPLDIRYGFIAVVGH